MIDATKWGVLSLAATLIAPTILFAYAAFASYRAAHELADERIDRSLAISFEQALRIFRSIDVTLDSVEQITLGKTEAALGDTGSELSEKLKQFTRAFPDISSISWIAKAMPWSPRCSSPYPQPSMRPSARN